VVGPPVVRRLARQRDREPHGDARLPL
jgi:hypothetical protein